jgi:hypothetical protein
MRSQSEASKIQNPFGVMDVPDPNDAEVTEFAGRATLQESADDDNAQAWSNADRSSQHGTIEGHWSSRWNGGADPTVPGDTADQWKPGRAELRTARDRVYLLFDWDSGARKGTDRRAARGLAAAGRKIYQSRQPRDHPSLDRPNRERSKDRRALDRRASGLPQVEGLSLPPAARRRVMEARPGLPAMSLSWPAPIWRTPDAGFPRATPNLSRFPRTHSCWEPSGPSV